MAYDSNYGPWNALADILGAYIQKKSIDGAMDYADNFGKQVDSLNKQKYVQNPVKPEQYGDNAAKAAAQSLMPNTDWLGKNQPQTAAPLSTQGLLGAASQYGAGNTAPIQFQQPTLDAMNNFAKMNPAVQQKQKEYDDFAAAKAKNPEWYVGDTYVGDDAAARSQAEQSLAVKQQNTVPRTNPYQFKSGMEEYGFTGQKEAPLSYVDFVSKTKELKTHAMKELVAKYGEAAAKKAEAMIDQAITDKQSAYADRADFMARQQFYNSLGDTTSVQGMQNALMAAVEYNHAAKRLGREGIDTAMLGKILENGDTQIVSKNLGDRDVLYAVNKNGKSFGYDKNNQPVYYRPVAELAHGISPDTKANIQSKEKTNAENNRVKLQTTQMNNNNRLQVADINGQYGLQRAQISASNKDSKKLTAKQAGAIQELSELDDAAMNAINSGEALEKENTSVSEYCDKVKSLIHTGAITGDEIPRARNRAIEMQFRYNKKAAAGENGSTFEDRAAQYAGKIDPDYWKEYLESEFGPQP